MNSPLTRLMWSVLYSLAKLVDEQIGQAVAVDILGVDPHARLRLALVVVGRAGGLGGVVEGAVAPVEEEEIRVHVVGDVNVDQAIAVRVGGDGARSRGRRIRAGASWSRGRARMAGRRRR